MLRQRGAEVIDADRVYRSLAIPDRNFGGRSSSGSARRSSDQTARSTAPRWEESSSPIPRRLPIWTASPIQRSLPRFEPGSRRSSAPLVVLEAVKLVQSGLASDVDAYGSSPLTPKLDCGV